MSFLTTRLARVKPSPTIAVTTKAAELKAAGKDVIGLGAGEPDFDTPEHIKQAAVEAIKRGETKYTAVGGTPALKKAIIDKFKRENGLEYAANQIVVGGGAKQVIFNALMATINDGDEVIIPAPFWVSYPDMVLFAGGTPVVVACPGSQGFKLNPADLAKAITPKTKWLILNSPSNPTGAVYTESELRAIADVLLAHEHVYVIADDIYEHIVYDNVVFKTLAQIEPKLYARTLTVNGVSKAFSMTGWRIGYGAGDKKLISAITDIQSHSTSNPCSISQAASVAALNQPLDFMKEWVKSFQQRRDNVVNGLNAIPGMSCANPQGAFYVFPNCSGFFGQKTPGGKVITDSTTFCEYLLEDALVAAVAGSAFGLEGHFRISYATSDANLAKALERIKEACGKLSKQAAA
ncbi:MAG TPA: pyridoxal phosphate-dependent aminotransferase [Rickettsiales bacterium]|nr:pyridoxal phosphate-dependent aminotransferase [Rickettsiales bacterium]